MSESNFHKLQDGITALSNSKDWYQAKLEWQLKDIYQESGRECLCGQNPIKNICVLENIHNGNISEVGNVCVNKFLGITSASAIFTAINRCYKDLTKSMGKNAFHYMIVQSKHMNPNSDCKLTAWEIDFYSDTLKKKKLSEKQEKYRIKVNKKFLKFTVRKLKDRPIK